MGKSWINAPINSKTFRDGAQNFISFARVRSIRGSIKCPCNRCCLGEWVDLDKAHGHILRYGFLRYFCNAYQFCISKTLANRTQDLDSLTLHCRGRCLDYYDMLTIRRWIHIAVMRKAKQLVLPPCLVSNLDSYQHSLRHKNMKKSDQSEAPTMDNIVDRISSLPDPILHVILSRLHSTEEVIRTRVLSTRWKYLWTSIPSVDISCYRGKSRLARVDTNKFKEFVYWVLANSILDLDSFTLNCLEYSDNSTIGRWIYLLVMKKIKQLDLKFLRRDNGNVIVLPRCLVDCDSLEVLKLDLNWSFLSLSSFTGSRTLKVLNLDKVELLDHELVRKFLVNCPLLEELSLIDCYAHNLDYLSISCPNLKTLRIEHLNYCERLMVLCPKLMYLEYGGCKAKQLQLDVKSLKKAVIKHKYIQQKDEICKLFAQVSHVEYLSVKYFFVNSILFACKRLNCPEEGLLGSLPKLKTLELTLASLSLTFYKLYAYEETMVRVVPEN
ncbi:F-box domain, Leucine-rich repeat domain, L domain-like protein [Artemisia annua]|uniref:F-box domain, Leucine-rich repeat domain, L domain-like protein n=1 Tax=Artemisia annua TaxID=35608 RepID=A0A2U1MUZ7_ARTAN|nr:F-box domain, Leucine-rich repeat domain, L domain-like protein [Artemisia annua]